MKLSTLKGKMSLLSVGTNSKTIKSDTEAPDTLTAILYLSPHTLGERGNTCAHASEGCKAICLYTAGRGKFSTVQLARKRKTQLFFDDNSAFMVQMNADLMLFSNYCKEHNMTGYVRLNGTSDIDWQKLKINNKNFFEHYPNLNFYDYTKDVKRVSNFPNYSLTFSWSENVSLAVVSKKIKENINVAIVFDTLPKAWNNIPVIDGDISDLRPLDSKRVIVGLKAKGLARTIDTDFVIKTVNI